MKKLFITIPVFIVLLLPVLVLGADDPNKGAVQYTPLIEIDGLTNSVQGEGFSQYVSFLYGLSIAIAALLAIIKIIIAGVKYMLSSLPGTKGNAKSEIQGALLGLLLILGAYLILNTINPALTNTTIEFDNIKPQATLQTRPPAVRSTAGGPTVPSGSPVSSGTSLAQLQQSLPECARRGAALSTTPTSDVSRLDTSGCTVSLDKQTAIRLFSEGCRAIPGGQPAGSGNSFTCTVPKPANATTAATPTGTQTASLNCTPGISRKTEGNFTVTTYDLTKCSNTTVNPVLDNKTPFIYYRDDFTKVCKQNSGTFTSSSAGIYQCRAPK